ncbi:MAG TPA: SH3 domain-containing protein [Candidatus Heimdallarchaeota archaeon]|nr:SH3 domain-containing protein [Candidatus Heimdallarchaeota archaeon]
MKNSSRMNTLLVCVFIVLVTVLIAETLMVKVQTTHLRKEPKFYASTIAMLKAGEVVEKISASNGWYQVRTTTGIVGWLHSSAVQTGKFDLAAMDKPLTTKATADEIALAGKGFNKKVEENYKSKHSEANFAGVDRMLKIKVSQSQLLKFLKDGKLGIYGGRP